MRLGRLGRVSPLYLIFALILGAALALGRYSYKNARLLSEQTERSLADSNRLLGEQTLNRIDNYIIDSDRSLLDIVDLEHLQDFARRWIENRAIHRPRGARLIAQELKAKGIPQDVLAEALDEAEIDETADALELARQRARQLSELDSQVRERRLIGFLSRRGYGFDVIRTVLNTLREESGSDEDLAPDA